MKVGIVGYGNLGKGVESAVQYTKDMELIGIFTRRNPACIKSKTNVKVYTMDEIERMVGIIDVFILCGGSAKDLPKQTKMLAKYFNVVDSYDVHGNIYNHFKEVDDASKSGKHISIISIGWDPGLFSLQRLYGQAILPNGKDYTFWGKGISQGHSDAIRKIDGVIDAREYTIPKKKIIEDVKQGKNINLAKNLYHIRECYVVVKNGIDTKKIEHQIKTMPYYFNDYETHVHFITQTEMDENYNQLSHGGSIFRNGVTGYDHEQHHHTIEYTLKLDSNPEFTASVLVAYARAAYRLKKEGQIGCRTIFDIAPWYLHESNWEELIKNVL